MGLPSGFLDIERKDRERTVSALRDDLGQSLTGMSLMLRSLADRAQLPVIAREADQLVALMNRAIGSCRTLAKELSPVSEAHGGLVRAVRELAQAHGQARGVTTSVRSHGKLLDPLDESAADHLYKIAQSAIAHVLQGAGVAHLSVAISSRADTLVLTATGDGADIGADDPKAARELSIMRRHAEILGALLEIHTPPRGGERMTCTLHARPARRAADLLEQNPAHAGHSDFQV